MSKQKARGYRSFIGDQKFEVHYTRFNSVLFAFYFCVDNQMILGGTFNFADGDCHTGMFFVENNTTGIKYDFAIIYIFDHILGFYNSTHINDGFVEPNWFHFFDDPGLVGFNIEKCAFIKNPDIKPIKTEVRTAKSEDPCELNIKGLIIRKIAKEHIQNKINEKN